MSVYRTIGPLVIPKDDKKQAEVREDEGMGIADVKYGETMVFIQHASTGLWVSYQTFETKKRGIGRVEEKKVHCYKHGLI